jgi:GNAT superfamily N-acetyltransferase
LSTAVERNGYEFFRLFRHWPRAQVFDGPDLLWTLTDIPFPVFNAVADARLELDAADAAIDAAIARCRSHNVPMIWTTGPSTRPADLGERLVAHGFNHDEDEPQMAVDLQEMHEGSSAPPGLAIEQVRDRRMLARWCWVLNAGFGMPAFAERAWLELYSSIAQAPHSPIRLFIGYLDGSPVATSGLLLAGGVAGVVPVTTLPGFRCQGIGTAMTLAALREARAIGYRIGVLGASEMGAGIYRRIGFRECCTFGAYVWGSDSAAKRFSDSATAKATVPPSLRGPNHLITK